jgi:Dolichyl-phosphate-mannose-protein mannosyltransferase
MPASPPSVRRCASADASGLRKPDICLAAMTAAAALLFATVGIGRPIWADDACAQWIARHGLLALFAALRDDNSLPAYYVLLSFWMRIFGDSEPALRSLSALFYLGGAAAAFLLARSIFRDLRAAVYAAVFYVGSAQAIWQAQAVRMYSMLGFLTAISIWLFWRIFVQQAQPGIVLAYLAINLIGMLTQIWFCFVLLAQFVALRRERKRFMALAAAPALLFAVLWGPALVAQLRNGSTHWLPPFQLWFVADSLLGLYATPIAGLKFGDLAIPAVASAVLIIGVVLWRRPGASGFRREPGTRILCAILAVTVLAPLAVSIVKPIYAPHRYSIISLPPAAVMLGTTVARFASRPCAAAIAMFLLLTSAVWHIHDRHQQLASPPPFWQNDRTTAAYIAQHARPGDAVVFTGLTRAAADYYFHRFGAESRFLEASFPADLDRHPGWMDGAALLRRPEAVEHDAKQLLSLLSALAAQGKRIWVYYGYDVAVSDFLKRKLDRQLAIEDRYDLRGPFHTQLLVYAR